MMISHTVDHALPPFWVQMSVTPFFVVLMIIGFLHGVHAIRDDYTQPFGYLFIALGWASAVFLLSLWGVFQ